MPKTNRPLKGLSKRRPRMSRTLLNNRQRQQLYKSMNRGRLALQFKVRGRKARMVKFKGKKLYVKFALEQHPNMRAHVKAIKMVYNELWIIYKRRLKSRHEKPLYRARFFDIAKVEEDQAIYEGVKQPVIALHPEQRYSLNGYQVNTARIGLGQLINDLSDAFRQFNQKTNGIIRISERKYIILSDLRSRNILIEGFDKKKAGRNLF